MDIRTWAEQLSDRRSKKVVFLSHCLLNENTRYPGGACRPGPIQEIFQECYVRGLGIVQMPCPEQLVWGGVLKRRMLVFFGSEGTALFRLKNSLLPIFLWYSKWRYRRLARQIAGQVEDYFSSGMTVIAIFGVDGSPSCGVHRTLDLKRSLDKIARLSNPASADDMNSIVRACVVGGRGLFIDLLRKEVERLRLKVPFLAHDLIAELRQRVTAGDPL